MCSHEESVLAYFSVFAFWRPRPMAVCGSTALERDSSDRRKSGALDVTTRVRIQEIALTCWTTTTTLEQGHAVTLTPSDAVASINCYHMFDELLGATYGRPERSNRTYECWLVVPRHGRMEG